MPSIPFILIMHVILLRARPQASLRRLMLIPMRFGNRIQHDCESSCQQMGLVTCV